MTAPAPAADRVAAGDLFSDTATLGMKAATVAAMHHAAGLLGGRAARHTAGHNYVVYRMPPAGASVALPPPSRHNGGGEVGRNLLRDIVRQFREAGVPAVLVAYAFADASGTVWHRHPKRRAGVCEALKSCADAVARGEWSVVLNAARVAPEPDEDEAPDDAPSEAEDAAEGTSERWSDLTLRDVVAVGVPDGVDGATLDRLTRSFGRQIGMAAHEPYASLVASGDVERYDVRDGRGKRPRWRYRFTERGAMALAQEAEARMAKESEVSRLAEKSEVSKVAERRPSLTGDPVWAARRERGLSPYDGSPVAGPEDDADLVARAAEAGRAAAKSAREDRPSDDEVLWRLALRFGVRPRYRRDGDRMELRVVQFLRDVEAASRDDDPALDTFGRD